MALTFTELRDLSAEELEQTYDRTAAHVSVGLELIRVELARREFANKENRMLRLTWTIAT
jgi:hypothetical protein